MSSNLNIQIPKDPLQPLVVFPMIPPSSSTNNPPNTSCNTQHEQYALSNKPYTLHHSDTSNLVLVTEPLTDDNYVTWSYSIVLALSIQKKLKFIDGSTTKLVGELLPLWITNNNVVIVWILNTISKGISSSILFTESARAIWINLRDCFQKRNGPQIFKLKLDLLTHMQDQEFMRPRSKKGNPVEEERCQEVE